MSYKSYYLYGYYGWSCVIGVVGSFDFHNFDLEPHSNIFLAHWDVPMSNLQVIRFTYVMVQTTRAPFPLVFSS